MKRGGILLPFFLGAPPPHTPARAPPPGPPIRARFLAAAVFRDAAAAVAQDARRAAECGGPRAPREWGVVRQPRAFRPRMSRPPAQLLIQPNGYINGPHIHSAE